MLPKRWNRRMRRSLRNAAFLAALFLSAPLAAKEWHAPKLPTQGPAEIFGGPANGCIAGAQALPPDGPGYQAVRLSRNRNWSHPQTISYIRDLGARARAAGLTPLYIGDLSQPRGGPMRDGHASHQNGTDVDVWFNLNPKPSLPASQREIIDIVRLVTSDEKRVDPAQFRPEHARLLQMAAAPANVDRVLVHYAIKKHLCESLPPGERGWLRKLRPWVGHNEHFHVRLACPPGNASCQTQAAIPPGDGCDATLDWWFADAEERRRTAADAPAALRARQSAPPRPKLPAQCATVLAAP
jgi:penicillin-insensitive murein endopeptidase